MWMDIEPEFNWMMREWIIHFKCLKMIIISKIFGISNLIYDNNIFCSLIENLSKINQHKLKSKSCRFCRKKQARSIALKHTKRKHSYVKNDNFRYGIW